MTAPRTDNEKTGRACGAELEMDRVLTLWVHTEELWHALGTAANTPLGRFKTWAALEPKRFHGASYDLDAMLEWARAHGIPYTDERAIHHQGTTGIVDHASGQLTLHSTDRLSASTRAFEDAARAHLQHSPQEWTVQKVTPRQWTVTDHRGATIATRTTRKAAHAAITDSPERHVWDGNRAWYLGRSTDPRNRELTTTEQAVIDRILAETTPTTPTEDARKTPTRPLPQ